MEKENGLEDDYDENVKIIKLFLKKKEKAFWYGRRRIRKKIIKINDEQNEKQNEINRLNKIIKTMEKEKENIKEEKKK